MLGSFTVWFTCLVLVAPPPSLSQSADHSNWPSSETLSYDVEWRLIHAGEARISMDSSVKNRWTSKLHIESEGLVSKLYQLEDNYNMEMKDAFCAEHTTLSTHERSRRRETNVTYDYPRGKTKYIERDLTRNVSKTAEVEIPACVSDIIGGLYKLRTMQLRPGQSAQFLLSDGKKVASARIEAQAEEKVMTKAGTFNTIRYEAFVFNGVLYTRKAQLTIWITDDEKRLPVQIRARMGFPVGAITLSLDKEEHT